MTQGDMEDGKALEDNDSSTVTPNSVEWQCPKAAEINMRNLHSTRIQLQRLVCEGRLRSTQQTQNLLRYVRPCRSAAQPVSNTMLRLIYNLHPELRAEARSAFRLLDANESTWCDFNSYHGEVPWFSWDPQRSKASLP